MRGIIALDDSKVIALLVFLPDKTTSYQEPNDSMKMKNLVRWTATLGFPVLPMAVTAGVIVNLNPATALYDGGPVNDRQQVAPGSSSCVAAAVPENGFTFNLEFIPAVADLTGTVLLMEIGNTANGTGLFLVGGVPTFVSKQGSADGNQPEYMPAGLPDLDFNNQPADTNNIYAITNANSFGVVAARSSFGALQAGQRYTLALSFDFTNKFEFGLESCGRITTNIFITTGPTNAAWPGNNSLTVGGGWAVKASVGGLGGNAAGVNLDPAWDVDYTRNFAGAIERGIYWNLAGSITGMQASAQIQLPAASSSQICGFGPANAVDNNPGTMWMTRTSATATTNEWLRLDLGQILPVDGAILTPMHAFSGFPVDYRIEYSADELNWSAAPGASFAGVPTPAGIVTNLFSSTVQARYLRFFGTRTSGSLNYQLAEFKAVLGARIAAGQPGLNIRPGNNAVSMSMTGTVSAAYQVEYLSALPGATCWITLTNVQLSSSPWTFQDSGATNINQRFYRAVGLPAYP